MVRGKGWGGDWMGKGGRCGRVEECWVMCDIKRDLLCFERSWLYVCFGKLNNMAGRRE